MKRLRNILISIIYLLIIQILFIFRRSGNKIYCTILYYHTISNEQINNFIIQLNLLKKITTPIPLNFAGPFNNKTRYCIITFDDAFRNVIINGVPDLIRLKVPFTIFVPAGQLGKNPGWLENTGHKDKFEIIASIDELLTIPSEIVIFGSHTINHYELNQLSYKNACIEIKESRNILESKLKKEIKYLSFPYGAYNSRIAQYCREIGYKQVFSIMPESPLTPFKNYVKGRIKIDPSDWKIEFILKILGGYGWKRFTATIKQKIRLMYLLGANFS